VGIMYYALTLMGIAAGVVFDALANKRNRFPNKCGTVKERHSCERAVLRVSCRWKKCKQERQRKTLSNQWSTALLELVSDLCNRIILKRRILSLSCPD
jgi:hypothetical protein